MKIKLDFVICRTSCPCVVNAAENSPELEEIKRVNHEYQVIQQPKKNKNIKKSHFKWTSLYLSFIFSQVEIQHLISGNRYDGKDDFAVVLQPFLQTSFIPTIGVSLIYKNSVYQEKIKSDEVLNLELHPSGG